MVELQQQMRVNQSELEQYVNELNVWEEDVKKKEEVTQQLDRGEDVAKATVSACSSKLNLSRMSQRCYHR